jgi:hypothetical protein
MTPPSDYKFLSEQAKLESLAEAYDEITTPKKERILEIYDQVAAEHGADAHDLFAHLYCEVKKSFPYFTSRDIRNIQRAIDSRTMDFDLPPEWLENPEHFFHKNYQEKHTMLVDLMKQNMKGLSFAEIRLQETVRYLDNMAEISESGRERRIEETATSITIQREALKRIEEEGA